MKILIIEDKETLCIGDLLLLNTEQGQTLITQVKDFNIGEIILEIIGGYAEYLEIQESY